MKNCLNSGLRFYTGGVQKKRKLFSNLKLKLKVFSDELRSWGPIPKKKKKIVTRFVTKVKFEKEICINY